MKGPATWKKNPLQRKITLSVVITENVIQRLHLPKQIAIQSEQFCRKVVHDDFFVKPHLPLAIGALAALYITCRINQILRTLNEIVSAHCIVKQQFASTLKKVRHAVSLLAAHYEIRLPLVDPTAYITRITEKAGAPPKEAINAKKILGQAINDRVGVGRTPVALAAAAVHFTLRLNGQIHRTPVQVAKAAGISEPTLRSAYRLLLNWAQHDSLLQSRLIQGSYSARLPPSYSTGRTI